MGAMIAKLFGRKAKQIKEICTPDLIMDRESAELEMIENDLNRAQWDFGRNVLI